jgi:hypothetical protein
MPGNPTAPNPLPALRFDVTRYGARPGGADCTAAAQRAVDAAAAAVLAIRTADGTRMPRADIFFPGSASTYCFNDPVYIDSSFIWIKGEGFGSKVAMLAQRGFSPFLFGLNRAGAAVPGATYRPDLFGKLDSSFAAGAGQKWGVRFRGDSFIISPASALSHGGRSAEYPGGFECWHGMRRFTVEFAAEGFSSGQLPGGLYLFGQGSLVRPAPLIVRVTGTNTFSVTLGTQAARLGTTTARDFTFSSGSATGVQKITLQVDCIAGTVKAAVNRVEVAVAGTLPANCYPNENLCNQWVFNNYGDIPSVTQGDWSLLGFGVSLAPRYTFAGTGQSIARIDAGTMTDAYSFGTTDPNTLAAFLFTEDPAAAPRHLALWGPQSVSQSFSSAFLVNNAGITPSANYCGIEDIEVAASSYGYAVALYYVLEFQASRLCLHPGCYGIGDIPRGANYRILLDEVLVGAGDAGLYFYQAIVEANRVDFATSARSAVVLVGVEFSLTNANVAGASAPAYSFLSYFVGGYGGKVALDHVGIDNEDNAFLQAGLYFEREATGMSVQVNDVVFTGFGTDIPTIKLVDASVGGGVAWIEANLVGTANVGALVQSDGRAWSGAVTNSHGDHSQHVENLDVNGPSHVTVIESRLKCPPRYGTWYAGNSIFEVPGPADGQYGEFRVAGAGTFGSAAPPRFLGLDAIQANPTSSLSAYALDHTAIAATLSGQASDWGMLTEYASIQIALMLFGNQGITVPATWSVGLSTLRAFANPISAGYYPEPTAGGYTRGTLANSSAGFAAASAGSKASAAAVTFGTFAAAATIRSIFLMDEAGIVWAHINLASPLSVGIGVTPTINSGALTFTHGFLPGTFGGLTDFGWGKVLDKLFRNTAFTVPTTFYHALSTAAVTKTTTGLTELSGGGYARVAAVNNLTNFGSLPLSGGDDRIQYQRRGDSTNGTAVAFPTPSGSQGTAVAWALADDPTAGNTWAVAPLPNSVAPNTGTGAPTFAVGALTIGC